jgi:hypothetical protein
VLRRRALSFPAFFGGNRKGNLGFNSAFQLPRQEANVGVKLGVARAQLLDLPNGVDDSRMVASPEPPTDVGQRLGSQLLRQVHRDLPRPRDFTSSPGGGHLGLSDSVVLGDLRLDFVDRN